MQSYGPGTDVESYVPWSMWSRTGRDLFRVLRDRVDVESTGLMSSRLGLGRCRVERAQANVESMLSRIGRD